MVTERLTLPPARPMPVLSPVALLPRDVDEAAFRDFIRLHVARQDAAPATVALYVREAQVFREWIGARGIALRDLTNRDVREWVAELVARRQSPKTIATRLTAVRRLCDAAVDAGVLDANPAAGVQAPKDKREGGAAAQRTLSLDEIPALLATCDDVSMIGERDRAMLSLLIGHGLRSVEIERLDVVDVDVPNRTARVKGKTRERTVFLRADVAQRLAAIIARRPDAAPTDPLFIAYGRAECNGKGKRLTRRGIRFIVDRAYGAAGMLPTAGKRAARADGAKVPTTHGLRATNITLALEAGAFIQNVAVDVGHADARTTMGYYSRARRRENNSALLLPVEF